MFAQLFESFRKASESSLQAQQDLFKRWVQQWPTPMNMHPNPGEWSDSMQRRWSEMTMEALQKHRELLDATYRSGIEVIEQSFRVGEAKSPEDYRRLVEELWTKLSDSFKAQSESQFREFQHATSKWMDIARNGSGASEANAARA